MMACSEWRAQIAKYKAGYLQYKNISDTSWNNNITYNSHNVTSLGNGTYMPSTPEDVAHAEWMFKVQDGT